MKKTEIKFQCWDQKYFTPLLNTYKEACIELDKREQGVIYRIWLVDGEEIAREDYALMPLEYKHLNTAP